jgi:hypothetical protein
MMGIFTILYLAQPVRSRDQGEGSSLGAGRWTTFLGAQPVRDPWWVFLAICLVSYLNRTFMIKSTSSRFRGLNLYFPP